MILVAGLPSSGNRLVKEHIVRGVRTVDTKEVVQIWHGDNRMPNLTRPDGERLRMVVPVRDEAARGASVQKRIREHGGHFPTEVQTMRKRVLGLVVSHDIPVYFVSYEGLIANPEGLGKDLFAWLGLPWVPWPTEEAPDPKQPYQGRLYNANAAHLAK